MLGNGSFTIAQLVEVAQEIQVKNKSKIFFFFFTHLGNIQRKNMPIIQIISDYNKIIKCFDFDPEFQIQLRNANNQSFQNAWTEITIAHNLRRLQTLPDAMTSTDR